MPNYVTHRCTASGDPSEIRALFSRILNTGGARKPIFDFNRLVPRPKCLDESQSPPQSEEAAEKFKLKTGFPDWYEWCIHNWGTKWNACDFKFVSDPEDSPTHFTFMTAWSPPGPILNRIAEEFPRVKIEISFFDEGWNFAGRAILTGGELSIEILEATSELYEEVYGEPYERES